MSRPFLEAMAKHLPPSASTLRLLDINGMAGGVLAELRPDLAARALPGEPRFWQVEAESADAVVAYDVIVSAEFLSGALRALRPGGRLIIVNPDGRVDRSLAAMLQQAGFTRTLVEAAIDDPAFAGVLMRGEKPHVTADTLARVEQVAARDADALDLDTFRGHYVHLLVRQTPNKPAWKLEAGEAVSWEALALGREHGPALLAFSSLPKAVGFMQRAVMAGKITGVNKVARFSRKTAQQWTCAVQLNPAPDVLDWREIVLVPVDPASAEAPEE